MKTRILIALTCLLLAGCCQTTATVDKDGNMLIKRTRFLVTEDIGSVSFDATDGSFTIDGYKTDMTKALEIIRLLAKKDEVKP